MSTTPVGFFSDSISHTWSSSPFPLSFSPSLSLYYSPSLSLSFPLSLSLCLSFFLCRLPGYYFEIRSICAIRINTQVGLSSASDTADPCSLFLIVLVGLTPSVETSTSICLHTHSALSLLLLVVLELRPVTYLFCSVRSTWTCWDAPWSWQAAMPSRFSGQMCIRMLW